MSKSRSRSPVLIIEKVSSAAEKIQTDKYFEKAPHTENLVSPIDAYWENIKDINKLLSLDLKKHSSLGLLVLLGYVSAVESYFRQLFRSIIFMDQGAKETCYSQPLNYGAALTQINSPELLPEALLEGCSFASQKTIISAIKNFLGLTGNPPNELTTSLNAFEQICQLRHCAAHRFGRLGSHNAIALGLDTHSDKIEAPLKLNSEDLDQIAAVCINVVKVSNNVLFDRLLLRTVKEQLIDWKWDFIEDRKSFQDYYKLFYSEKFSSKEDHSLKDVYRKFKANHD